MGNREVRDFKVDFCGGAVFVFVVLCFLKIVLFIFVRVCVGMELVVYFCVI